MKRASVAALPAIFVMAFLALGYLWTARRAPVLTVATWSGTYGHAQTTAQIVPFARASGADVRLAVYDGGTDELARQVASRKYDWDVADLELPDAVAACDAGLLEPVDAATLPAGAGGMPAADDFVPGAIGRCWVASVVYSQVVAVAPVFFGDTAPAKLADFFDVKRFVGKRALNRSSAKFTLEMALLADGAAPEEIYAVLSTPQGVARALAKLDTIRGDLVWYSNVDEAKRMLAENRAVFAAMPNWAVFDADNRTPAALRKLNIIWDRQLYELEAFGIPRGDPRRKLASDFVRFATRTDNLAVMASWVPYGPARRSAGRRVGLNPDLRIAMAPYLPTSHFETAFAVDDEWWRRHGAGIDALWQAWLAKSR